VLAKHLIEKVATSIEECGWEGVDVIHMNEVMALAAISTIYTVLIDHAREESRQDVIAWLAKSPVRLNGLAGSN